MSPKEFKAWKEKFKKHVTLLYESPTGRLDVSSKKAMRRHQLAHESFCRQFIGIVQDQKHSSVVRNFSKEIGTLIQNLAAKIEVYETMPLKNKSSGPIRIPNLLATDLLQVLEHAKGKRNSLNLVFDFLKANGEFETWHEEHYGNRKPKLSFFRPNKSLEQPTQWANDIKSKLIKSYFSDDRGKRVERLTADQKQVSTRLLSRLRQQPLEL